MGSAYQMRSPSSTTFEKSTAVDYPNRDINVGSDGKISIINPERKNYQHT